MRRSSSVAAFLALLGLGALTAGEAGAQPARPPGLTLPAGTLEATVTVEANLSDGAALEPLSVAPDLSYGITDDVTVSVVHSAFARTGFRAAAGNGVCLSGTGGGCREVYDNLGIEGAWSARRGPTAIAPTVGVHATSFDLGFYAAKAGVRVRHRAGAVTVLLQPSVLVAITERDPEAPAPRNPDRIWVPIAAFYQVTAPLALGLGTGFKSPLQDLGDSYELALGALATYKVSPALSAGASLTFGQFYGSQSRPDGVSALDRRHAQVWVTYRP